jgi:hypothetical protein
MSEGNEIVKPGSGIARQGFGTQEIEMRRETQGSALAARQQAEVQARYIVALQRPRNLDEVRIRLLKHCQRRGFAACAEYAKPVGGSRVVGASIRFVETALQEYGNVMPDSYVTYDDEKIRIIRVSMTDLERNITYHEDAVVEKLIERKSPKKGDVVIRVRENSSGNTTYVVQANNGDSELENRFAAEISKKTRNLGLRILPVDLKEEAIALCRLTLTAENGGKDPDAERKKCTDAFAEIGVMPTGIEIYLGHPLASASPAELADLRQVFYSVRDGHAAWQEFIDLRLAERGDDEVEADEAKGARAKITAKAEEARRRLAADAEAKAKAQQGGTQ